MNVRCFGPAAFPSSINALPAARASGFSSLMLSYGSNALTACSYLRPGLSRKRAAIRSGFVRLAFRSRALQGRCHRAVRRCQAPRAGHGLNRSRARGWSRRGSSPRRLAEGRKKQVQADRSDGSGPRKPAGAPSIRQAGNDGTPIARGLARTVSRLKFIPDYYPDA